jgi:uncharacterized protein (TIGR03663 family)
MNRAAFGGLFLCIVAGAFLVRLADLDRRPMHHDEANQAVKFASLLEKGEYRYDKADHHGPSLYYLTLPSAWISGKKTLARLDEKTLRIVPAIFGAGILLLLLLFRGLSPGAVLFAALFAALSPAMACYSRFYIQETILACFVLGFMAVLWRYLLKPSTGWALAAGFCAGMMYATKETAVIAFGATIGAALLTLIVWKNAGDEQKSPRRPKLTHMLLALAAAIFIAAILFSSFFQNPRGILDSLLSFKLYFIRSGEAGWHAHPWDFYLKMLAFSQYARGPVWSEALILVLALAGSIGAFAYSVKTKKGGCLAKYLFFYALIATAVYSLIRYKTPWNLLPFYVGIIMLAGHGASLVLGIFRKKYMKAFVVVILAVATCHLGLQCYWANFKYDADSRNPYVYAQTSRDFLKLVRRVEELAARHPEGKQMLIKVIAGPYETWPLPWYLRSFFRVGYWQDAAEAGPLEDVPLIIASREQMEKLQPRLEDMFRWEFYELRPEVLLVLYVNSSLF